MHPHSMILVVDVVDDNVESLECSPSHEIQNNFSGLEEEAEYELRLRAMNRWASWYSQEKNFWRNNFSPKKRWITSKAQEEYFKWKKPFLLYSLHLSLSLSEHLFIAISRQGWSGLSEPFHFRTAGPGDYRSDDLRFWVTKKGWIVGLADSEIINKMFVL